MHGRPLERADIERVLAPLERGRPFASSAFVDEDVFELERRRIFGRAWLCVGREDDAELPGQWFRADVAGEPVLIVRGADLRLRAFFDVCRHRGASLVGRERCGRSSRLACRYHGWTYDLDGRLAIAKGAPLTFAASEHGLVPARVDVWRGFVFVTLDDSLPELEAWLGEPPRWLAEQVLGPIRRGHRADYEVAANWKLLVENFQESHHFPSIHPALERLTPTAEACSWVTEGPWLGGTMTIQGAETVSVDGSRRGRPLVVAPERQGMVSDAMLFPGLLTSVQPDYVLVYRLAPVSAARTRVTFEIYFHPAAWSPRFDPSDVVDFWDQVNGEDRSICEEQQANARSRAFDPACYVAVEEGMHAFDRMVARVHADAREELLEE